MRTLTSLDQVEHLPHSLVVRTALLNELITPFSSADNANEFWIDHPTKLLALLPDEDIDLFQQQSANIFELFKCAEFITHLADNWYLALTITSQEGAGCYLLFPYGVHNTLDTLLSSLTTNE